MATNSTIAILFEDGRVVGTSCHFDGYLDGVGKTLFEHYQDPEKVIKLVSLGAISTLEPEIEPPEGSSHSFNKRLKGVTTFYGRDRGDPDTGPIHYDSLKEYFEEGDVFEVADYYYIYDLNKKEWFYVLESGALAPLKFAFPE